MTPRSLSAARRAAVHSAARPLLRTAEAVMANSRVPSLRHVARIVQERLMTGGGGDFGAAAEQRFYAVSLLAPCGSAGCRTCPIDELLDVLGPLGLLGAVCSAVELYGSYGDPHGLLSERQVEQLCAAFEHFATTA